MSTRAVYGFRDQFGTHHVYVHSDGYPTGAALKFQATLNSGLVWGLTRFEADEFGAAFIAANKSQPGGVRLCGKPEAHGDIEYYYVIYQAMPGSGPLYLEAYSVPFDDFINKKLIFKGELLEFIKTAKKSEEAA